MFSCVWCGEGDLSLCWVDVESVLFCPRVDFVEVRLEVSFCFVDVRVCGCDSDVVGVDCYVEVFV